MRIPKSWVPIIAARIVDTCLEKGLVRAKTGREKVLEAAEELILDELMVEDRLNDEVREMLRQYEQEIDAKRLDYRKLFEMTKQKLVRERNLIL